MQELASFLKITFIQVPDIIMMELTLGTCILTYTNKTLYGTSQRHHTCYLRFRHGLAEQRFKEIYYQT